MACSFTLYSSLFVKYHTANCCTISISLSVIPLFIILTSAVPASLATLSASLNKLSLNACASSFLLGSAVGT